MKVGDVARITGVDVRGRSIKRELQFLSVVLVEPSYYHTPTLWTVRVCITGKEIALYEDEMEVV